MTWEKVKLGDVYDVHNGLSKGSQYFGSGYPFLSFSTVFNHYFIPDEITEFVQSTEKEQENYSIKRGDVFITRTSETFDELGMSCVALKDYPQATYNGFTKRLRPKTNKILPEFIGYYFRTPAFRNEFQAFSTMTTRASLRNQELLGLSIPVPPMEMQKRIADVLSAYDDLIENNERQIRLLEEAAQRLYKEWFIRLHFPGYKSTPIIDGVPEGWKVSSAGALAPIITGKKDANFGSASGKYLFFTCAQEPLRADNFSFDEDAVILAGNGDFNVKLYRGKFEAYQRTYVLAPHEGKFLFILFFAVQRDMRILHQGASGSTIKFLTKGMIQQIRALIPPENLLTKFNDVMNPIQTDIENLRTSCNLAIEARDRLLSKLMNGEIEV